MKIEDIFRFPMEEEWEQALCALSWESVITGLERIENKIPKPSGYRQAGEQLCAVLAVMEREIDRFLHDWNGKTNVFGGIRDPEGLYLDYCGLQGVFEEGIQRLSEEVNESYPAIGTDPCERWAVKRLAQGIVRNDAITDRAKALLRQIETDDIARDRLETRRELVRAFLRTAVQAYGNRALVLSDVQNGGKGLQAGALLALTAELRTAMEECKKGLDEMRDL